MKIKLMMEKRNLTVDLESEKAELLFNAFALKLLGIEEGTAVAEIVSDTVLHKDHCTAEAPAIEQKLPDIATDRSSSYNHKRRSILERHRHLKRLNLINRQ